MNSPFRWHRAFLLWGLSLTSVVLPLLYTNQYILHLLIIGFMLSVLALGVRLVMITGQWTFGQAAFQAIGAYSCVMLRANFGLTFWMSLPLAGLFAALFALVIGYPILRLRGIYFSMLTLCLGEVIRTLALEWKSVTGGPSGMIDVPHPDGIAIGSITLVQFGPTNKIPYYYTALFILFIALVVIHRIDVSRLGRSFRAIRQSDNLAESLGINVAWYKVIAFAVGSFFSGICGAFLPAYLGTLYPSHFNIWQSIYPVVHVIVGGLDHIFGPVAGTFFVTFLFELTRASPEMQQLLYAFTLIAVILLLPHGLMGITKQSQIWISCLTRGFAQASRIVRSGRGSA